MIGMKDPRRAADNIKDKTPQSPIVSLTQDDDDSSSLIRARGIRLASVHESTTPIRKDHNRNPSLKMTRDAHGDEANNPGKRPAAKSGKLTTRPASPPQDKEPRASNIRLTRKAGNSQAENTRRGKKAAPGKSETDNSPPRQPTAVDRSSFGTSLISSIDIRDIDETGSERSSGTMDKRVTRMQSVQRCLEMLRNSTGFQSEFNPAEGVLSSADNLEAPANSDLVPGGPLARLRRLGKNESKPTKVKRSTSVETAEKHSPNIVSNTVSQPGLGKAPVLTRPTLGLPAASATTAALIPVKFSADSSQFSFRAKARFSAKTRSLLELLPQDPKESALSSQAPPPPPPAADSDHLIKASSLTAVGEDLVVVDIFRNGRPPKRKRPTISGCLVDDGNDISREKVDFDEKDLECFNILPLEKRRRLQFVAKLKPLVSPGSTTLEYLSRIDLKKIERLMKLQPAFEYMRIKEKNHIGQASVLQTSALHGNGARSVDPNTTQQTFSSQGAGDLTGRTPYPAVASSTPVGGGSSRLPTTPTIDCPTGLTGFSVLPSGQSRLQEDAGCLFTAGHLLLDGYDDLTVERRPQMEEPLLVTRPGLFQFLAKFRQELAQDEPRLPEMNKNASLLARFSGLSVSFCAWGSHMATVAGRLGEEDSCLKNGLVQVTKADGFIRRCLLLRLAGPFGSWWKSLMLTGIRRKEHELRKQILDRSRSCTQQVEETGVDDEEPQQSALALSRLKLRNGRMKAVRQATETGSVELFSAQAAKLLWSKVEALPTHRIDTDRAGPALKVGVEVTPEQDFLVAESFLNGLEAHVAQIFADRLALTKKSRARWMTEFFAEVSYRLFAPDLENATDDESNANKWPLGANGRVSISLPKSVLTLEVVEALNSLQLTKVVGQGIDLTSEPPPLNSYGSASCGRRDSEEAQGFSEEEFISLTVPRGSLTMPSDSPDTTFQSWDSRLTPIQPMSWDLLSMRCEKSFRVGRSSLELAGEDQAGKQLPAECASLTPLPSRRPAVKAE